LGIGNQLGIGNISNVSSSLNVSSSSNVVHFKFKPAAEENTKADSSSN